MGAVYLGEHIRMGKKVAIKFLHTEFSADDTVVKRFFREAQVAATLQHANIIDVLDVGISQNEEPYMVMEYLEGESLAALIKRTGSLDLTATIGVMEPILNALANAHEVGVIHRDLKPENIFLVQPLKGDPLVKLIDFGISKLTKVTDLSRLTSEGALLGTPMFMSPEQVRGEELDHRSDLYGAGVILYMMLTGSLPFDADTYPLLFVKILTDNPTPPRETLPDFPLEIEPIVMKLLCKEPNQRYQSADDVLADLKELSQYSSRQEGLASYTNGASKKSIALGDLGNPISRIQGINTGTSRRYQRDAELKVDLMSTLQGGHFKDITFERTRDKKNTLNEKTLHLPELEERKELEALLIRVREFWVEGLLKRNCGLLGIMPQPKQLRDDLVAAPWEHTGRITPRTESLPPTQSFTNVYKRMQRRLLILGESGHGKTINLLKTLKHACDEAENHDLFEHPIPVLFTLSSWHPGKGTLFDWMVEELAIKYVIPRKYGKRWLEQRFILPFLDGLNEVQPQYMTDCIQAINAFNHRYTPRGLVVSSRKQEYMACGIKLKLNGAIVLESLAPETVSDFIHSNRWRHLGEAVKDMPELGEMLRVPLILHIACDIVDDNAEFFKAGTLSSELSDTIFKRYIDLNLRNRNYERKRDYTSTRTGKALHQLAEGMLKTGDTVFHFETLQPKWFRRRAMSIVYVVLSRMIVALILGLSIILATGLSPLNNAGFKTSMMFGTQLGMGSALILGLGYGVKTVFGMSRNRDISFLKQKKKTSLMFILLFTFVCGLAIGGILYSIHGHMVVAVMGVQVSMIGGALLGLYRRNRSTIDADIVPVEAISWRPSGLKSRRFLGVLLGGFVSAVASASFEDDLKSGLHCFLAVALIGIAIQGFVKGHRSIKAVPNVGIVQSLKNAMFTGVMGFVLTTFVFGYSYGVIYGACVGITVAAFIALWFGGMEVVNHIILRSLLSLEGTLSFFIRKRLSDAVNKSMLRQVGGGFMFEHETLIKHFAGVPNVTTEP